LSNSGTVSVLVLDKKMEGQKDGGGEMVDRKMDDRKMGAER